MIQKADILIVLPGGVGTIAELACALNYAQIAANPREILCINLDGFYDDLLRMLDRLHCEGFALRPPRTFLHEFSSCEKACEYLSSLLFAFSGRDQGT
jgi:predicted Rossmann-fold nucleotide-binding protein